MREHHFFELFKSASAVIMDVDGVLTDSSLLLTEEGDQLRVMSIRDGYALQLAVKQGLVIVVITGGNSKGVVKRLERLGIIHIYSGVRDKHKKLKKIGRELKLDLSTSVYIGDDIPDAGVMGICGIPCCPHDSIPEILSLAKYVSPFGGGKGCVRDILEKILKLQGKWI